MNNAEEKGFDPVKGCQAQGTGVLAAFLILSLITSYAFFKKNVLSGGGPQVPLIFGLFPKTFQFVNVNRDYFDIALIVLAGFFFMVTWELNRSRWVRGLTLLIALLATILSWKVKGDTFIYGGWEWTRMEIVLVGLLVGFLLPWFFRFLTEPPPKIVLSPVGWALKTALCRWGSGLVVFTLVWVVAFHHPFYLNSYYENWRITCDYLYATYLFAGLPYAFVTNLLRGHKKEEASDPGYVFFLFFKSGLLKLLGKGNLPEGNLPKEKNLFREVVSNRLYLITLRDQLVKVFYIPLMTIFLFQECGGYFWNLPSLVESFSKGNWYNTFNFFYYAAFHSIFIMDTSLALIGYASSSRWLGNKSKSVENTWGGWIVALACYPPFNGLTNDYLPYHAPFGTPFGFLQSPFFDVPFKIIILLCYGIYVWATMTFGLRFSNLTHRGIITRGPYAVIRHPAYAAKNLAWWLESVRQFSSFWQFLFLTLWNVIYYLRAITEERHLGQDPDYHAYCRRVRYKFIPGIW